MLHSVYNLHGCIQISTTQTVVDDCPHWMALNLTILLHTQTLKRVVRSFAKAPTMIFFIRCQLSHCSLQHDNIKYRKLKEMIVLILLMDWQNWKSMGALPACQATALAVWYWGSCGLVGMFLAPLLAGPDGGYQTLWPWCSFYNWWKEGVQTQTV